MSDIYCDYKIAVLDASFFVSLFSKEVKDGLNHTNVYVADTFNSEVEQYRTFLEHERRKLYDANIRFLQENIRPNTLDFVSFGAEAEHLHNDVWGMLTLLAGLKARAVVVTANQLLIQKIILYGLQVDIYDLNADDFIKFPSFSTLKSRYRLKESEWSTPPVKEKAEENSVLYGRNGLKITLGKEIKAGLEANLYLVKEDKTLVAKVFKKDKLSASKFQNIKRLVEIQKKLEIKWAIFPADILYYDENCKNPAGLVETYMPEEENLGDNSLFLGDLVNIPPEDLKKKQSYAVDLCLKMVRQVCFLNVFGFFLSDYNMSNFAEIRNNNKKIQMWDTDSFGFGSFFGKFFSPDYRESINHPKYDMNTKEGAIDICNDALYQFVFSVLSLGDTPISEYTGKFKYDNPNYIALWRRKFFPPNVWNHLEEVFQGKKAPSAEALMRQLSIADHRFQENPASDKTWKELFLEVMPGYREMAEEEQEESEEKEEEKREKKSENPGKDRTISHSSNHSSRSRKKPKWKKAVILLILLGALCAIGYYSNSRRNGETSSTAAPTVDSEITGVKVSLDKTEIRLKKGASETLTVSALGDLPESYYFKWGTIGEDPKVSVEWGDWVGENSEEVTLTGDEISEGYVVFFICKGDGFIASTSIYVTVAEEE